jgi:hypothetical protein
MAIINADPATPASTANSLMLPLVAATVATVPLTGSDIVFPVVFVFRNEKARRSELVECGHRLTPL